MTQISLKLQSLKPRRLRSGSGPPHWRAEDRKLLNCGHPVTSKFCLGLFFVGQRPLNLLRQIS